MNFPDKLRKLRKERNLTQEDLANSIFVSRTMITKYENGTVYPTKENIEKIALFFNVKISDLIDENDSVKLSLESIKISKSFDNIIMTASIIVCSLFVFISFVPLLKGWKYVYPIPSGQDYPNKEYYTWSILYANIKNNNPIAIIAIVLCLINIGVYLFWKLNNNLEKRYWLVKLGNILFVVNLFLIFITLIFAFSYAL